MKTSNALNDDNVNGFFVVTWDWNNRLLAAELFQSSYIKSGIGPESVRSLIEGLLAEVSKATQSAA